MDWCALVIQGCFDLCIITEIYWTISVIMTKENKKHCESTKIHQKNPNFPEREKRETPGRVCGNYKLRMRICAQTAKGNKNSVLE